jgi:FdhE protein
MQPPWENGPQRIEHLITERSEAREILTFYQSLLFFQRSLFESLGQASLSGSLSLDLAVLAGQLGTFLRWVCDKGSTLLRSQAHEMIEWESHTKEELILSYGCVEAIAGENFFPKAILQPYAAFLAQHRIPIQGRRGKKGGCPFCGAAPQMALLQNAHAGAAGEGAKRFLVCSLCFTDWPINRCSCASCKEVDPDKLPYYQSESLPTVRIEACNTCKHYIKRVDLTKDARAVPLIDEIATPALDLWAQENGYTKVELNLAGI